MLTQGTTEFETVESNSEPPADTVDLVETGGGLLVFTVETEYRPHLHQEIEIARELSGFANVSDWVMVRESLRCRGLSVGAAVNLPEYTVDKITD